MRIAVEAWAAEEVPGGRGRVVRGLVRGLASLDADHELVLLTRRPWAGADGDWVRVPGRGPTWVVAAAAVARRRRVDAVLATTSYALTALAPCSVAVVYDLLPLQRPGDLPRGAALERLTLPLAVRRAGTLLCLSEPVRAGLRARHPGARAVLWPPAVDDVFRVPPDPGVLLRHGLRPDGYALAVGTVEPRKNLPRLAAAWSALPADVRAGRPLVVVGPAGWGDVPLPDGVRVLGPVPDAALPSLYAGATVVAYPSLGEGYGLPVAEALTCGAVVVCSAVPAVDDVGRDAVVLVTDPTSAADLAAALQRALTDGALRARLRATGPQRTAGRTWPAAAAEALAAVERAVTSPG